jgi:ankyrin repeat protein
MGDDAAVIRIAADDIGSFRISKPLHAAALNETSQNLVEVLMQVGNIDIEEADDEGFSALHRMAMNNRLNGAVSLLAHGASVDRRTQVTEETSLHLASRAKHIDMAIILLAHGADVTIRNSSGFTPADIADPLFWKSVKSSNS